MNLVEHSRNIVGQTGQRVTCAGQCGKRSDDERAADQILSPNATSTSW